MAEEKKTRKVYDKEYKESAVKLLIDSKRSQASVARDLGITINMLQRWRKQYLDDLKNKNLGNNNDDNTIVDMAEYKRVLRENAMLKEQREILKKAVTFFSQNEK